jgi:uncharacterized protein (DUF433 family)
MEDEYVYEEPPEIQIVITPRAQAALDELQALIAARYPEATFATYTWYDIAGIYLKATVDVEDVDEVRDVFRDRLLDMQVEDGIPVEVDVRQPPERTWAQTQATREEQWQARKKFASLPDRIVQDREIMGGAPVVKGTLVQVEMVLAYLARTLDFEEVMSFYPELTPDDVRTCLAFAPAEVADAPRRADVSVAATR